MLRSLILFSSIALSSVYGDDNSHTVRFFVSCVTTILLVEIASICIWSFKLESVIAYHYY
jgi:hypothetical protein